MIQSEKQLHTSLCEWIKIAYPNAMFNTDMSGLNLPKGMAIQAAKLRSNRGFPDLFIIEPLGGYSGLFIELKREGTKLKKLNGDWATEHIKEQSDVMAMLEFRGFKCAFCCGWNQATFLIKSYLSGQVIKKKHF